MIALIGVSNAFSSVAVSLRLRRREFAMLYSVGLDGGGLNRLLFAEGLNFSLRPILLGLPLVLIVCVIFLWMTDIPWGLFLKEIPVGGILLYTVAALALMGLAYLNGAREVRKLTVVDALRDETV
jgi:putative ABC transport system permease protein